MNSVLSVSFAPSAFSSSFLLLYSAEDLIRIPHATAPAPFPVPRASPSVCTLFCPCPVQLSLEKSDRNCPNVRKAHCLEFLRCICMVLSYVINVYLSITSCNYIQQPQAGAPAAKQRCSHNLRQRQHQFRTHTTILVVLYRDRSLFSVIDPHPFRDVHRAHAAGIQKGHLILQP